ncbi:MAG: hypothetical protein JO111_11420 [Caulobacteraceae bacterium]|nr:hypothetical protein [Caulobacteraceae bacterium]
MTTPAGTLIAAAMLVFAHLGPPASAAPTAGIVQAGLAAILSSEPAPQVALEPAREPPEGSGVEFVRYASPPQLHNGFLAGGLLAWTSVLIGALLLLDKRRLAALTIAGSGVVVGVALMFTGVL